jgi:hypothetical protein
LSDSAIGEKLGLRRATFAYQDSSYWRGWQLTIVF